MITVVSLVKAEKEPYIETISSGGASGVPLIQKNVKASVLGFYSVGISISGKTKEYEAEVRDTPNGEQIDWEDDLHDLLTHYGCSDSQFHTLGGIICSFHFGIESSLPMELMK